MPIMINTVKLKKSGRIILLFETEFLSTALLKKARRESSQSHSSGEAIIAWNKSGETAK